MKRTRGEGPGHDTEALRVCHLIKGLGRGGAEVLLPQLIRTGDPDFRHSVGYFLPGKDALVAEIVAAGAPVECFGIRSNGALLASTVRVARWLRASRADLVHAHLPLTGVVARIAGRLAGIPVLYTEHNLQERYHPLTRLANRWTWSRQARVVAVSGEVAASIRRHLGERVPVTVVHNGIETERPAPAPEEVAALRSALDLPPAAPVVGTVAVQRAQKRLGVWLAAAGKILAERPETRFVIVGDGPLRGELEDEARRLGVASAVRFTGLQNDVAPYLALFDLFLASSEFEGLPVALLEAMAAGVPVVATAVGGVPEAVETGRDGILVAFDGAGTVAGLAEAALSLLADPARRERLAAAGRARVVRDFSVARMVRELETLYAEVARGGS